MAKKKRIVALDIGTSSIKLAEFTVDSSGSISLTNYGTSALGLDPHEEELRQEYTVATIREIMHDFGIKPGSTLVAVPGQSVFSRYVKLPPVDPDKIYQIVQYEAAQNVPFPIEEVVWDYQLLGSDAGGEMDVLLVAMKEEIINEITSSVTESGLDTDLVDVAPMAIFNAVKYNYGDSDECTLVLDMGARSTDLIFIEGDRVFNRSIPVAGNAITQQIAKELDISFEDAEEMKIENAFVSFGGAFQGHDDPNIELVSKCVRSVMTKLHAEINRSINFYRGQQKGAKPTSILMTGGTSAIAHIDTFLEDKLKVDVSFLNPFQEVAVSNDIDSDMITEDANILSEVVGLGLRETGACSMELNLIPPHITNAKKFRKKQPALVLALGLVALAVGFMALSSFIVGKKKQEQLVEVKQQIQGLKSKDGEIKKALAEQKEAEGDIATLDRIPNARLVWPRYIDEISKVVPEGMWITSFTPLVSEEKTPTAGKTRNRGGQATETAAKKIIKELQIDGMGYKDIIKSRSVITEFNNKLIASEIFSDKTKILLTPAPTADDSTRSFRISIDLERPIVL